ncbi:MAG: hypothetical protein QW247_10700 [Pyrobaculum sp.]
MRTAFLALAAVLALAALAHADIAIQNGTCKYANETVSVGTVRDAVVALSAYGAYSVYWPSLPGPIYVFISGDDVVWGHLWEEVSFTQPYKFVIHVKKPWGQWRLDKYFCNSTLYGQFYVWVVVKEPDIVAEDVVFTFAKTPYEDKKTVQYAGWDFGGHACTASDLSANGPNCSYKPPLPTALGFDNAPAYVYSYGGYVVGQTVQYGQVETVLGGRVVVPQTSVAGVKLGFEIFTDLGRGPGAQFVDKVDVPGYFVATEWDAVRIGGYAAPLIRHLIYIMDNSTGAATLDTIADYLAMHPRAVVWDVKEACIPPYQIEPVLNCFSGKVVVFTLGELAGWSDFYVEIPGDFRWPADPAIIRGGAIGGHLFFYGGYGHEMGRIYVPRSSILQLKPEYRWVRTGKRGWDVGDPLGAPTTYTYLGIYVRFTTGGAMSFTSALRIDMANLRGRNFYYASDPGLVFVAQSDVALKWWLEGSNGGRTLYSVPICGSGTCNATAFVYIGGSLTYDDYFAQFRTPTLPKYLDVVWRFSDLDTTYYFPELSYFTAVTKVDPSASYYNTIDPWTAIPYKTVTAPWPADLSTGPNNTDIFSAVGAPRYIKSLNEVTLEGFDLYLLPVTACDPGFPACAEVRPRVWGGSYRYDIALPGKAYAFALVYHNPLNPTQSPGPVKVYVYNGSVVKVENGKAVEYPVSGEALLAEAPGPWSDMAAYYVGPGWQAQYKRLGACQSDDLGGVITGWWKAPDKPGTYKVVVSAGGRNYTFTIYVAETALYTRNYLPERVWSNIRDVFPYMDIVLYARVGTMLVPAFHAVTWTHAKSWGVAKCAVVPTIDLSRGPYSAPVGQGAGAVITASGGIGYIDVEGVHYEFPFFGIRTTVRWYNDTHVLLGYEGAPYVPKAYLIYNSTQWLIAKIENRGWPDAYGPWDYYGYVDGSWVYVWSADKPLLRVYEVYPWDPAKVLPIFDIRTVDGGVSVVESGLDAYRTWFVNYACLTRSKVDIYIAALNKVGKTFRDVTICGGRPVG